MIVSGSVEPESDSGSVSTALQSPIEYQRKEGGIAVTRPLSSGRPPSAPPTPNGHAPQPAADTEQDDQVWISSFFNPHCCKLFQTCDFVTFDPSGAGDGAAGLCGGARGRDLGVPGGEGPDSGVQPAGSESGVPAGQQRLAGCRGLGATQRAQHTLTHTQQGQSLVYYTHTHTDLNTAS